MMTLRNDFDATLARSPLRAMNSFKLIWFDLACASRDVRKISETFQICSINHGGVFCFACSFSVFRTIAIKNDTVQRARRNHQSCESDPPGNALQAGVFPGEHRLLAPGTAKRRSSVCRGSSAAAWLSNQFSANLWRHLNLKFVKSWRTLGANLRR